MAHPDLIDNVFTADFFRHVQCFFTRLAAEELEEIVLGILAGDGFLHLIDDLPGEEVVEFLVIGGQFGDGFDVNRMMVFGQQLADARGIVHGLVLEGGEAVVNHVVADIELLVLILYAMELVLHEFHLAALILHGIAATVHGPLLLDMLPSQLWAVVEQIVAYQDGQEQHQQEEDGYVLVLAGTLHTHHVVAQIVVGRHFLVELGVFAVVAMVDIPTVEGKGCYGRLVGDAEYDAGVGTLCLLQVMAYAVGHLERMLVGTFQVAEISAVGIAEGFQIGVIGSHGTEGGRAGNQEQNQFADAYGQAEEESAALPHLALGLEGADGEVLADFLVALDDAPTVQQSETVTALNLVGEKRGELLLGHSLTSIRDGEFHIIMLLNGSNLNAPALLGKLPGIVGNGVEHEERENLVGLHHGIGIIDRQFDAFQLETHARALHDVEEFLDRETLYLQLEFALAELNPLGQRLVVVVDGIGNLLDIGESLCPDGFRFTALLEFADFVNHAVDEGRDGVDEEYLGTVLQVAPLVLLQQYGGHLSISLYLVLTVR